jgi:hypothetical protein
LSSRVQPCLNDGGKDTPSSRKIKRGAANEGSNSHNLSMLLSLSAFELRYTAFCSFGQEICFVGVFSIARRIIRRSTAMRLSPGAFRIVKKRLLSPPGRESQNVVKP